VLKLGHLTLYGNKPIIVLSSRPLDFSSVKGSVIEQKSGEPTEIVRQFKERDFRHIYLDGFKSSSSDPWVRYSSSGKLFFACVGITAFTGLNPLSQSRRIGIFLAASDTGLAQDLKLKPASADMISTQVCNPGVLGLFGLTSCDKLATGEFLDHPSFSLLKKQDGSFRVVVCWVDFIRPSGATLIETAYLDDSTSTWSSAKTLAGGQVSSCTVGGSESQVAITWMRTRVKASQKQYSLEFTTSTDGQNWSSANVLANLGALVQGTNDASTTSKVLSAPYALVIPGQNGLRAVWQARDNSLSISELYIRDVLPKLGSIFTFGDPAVEKFLPGTGTCGAVAGTYEVTGSSGYFRYSVWSLISVKPLGPIFASGADLNAQYGKDDPNHPGFKRIGDYTGVDCSGRFAWASWTDLREGRPEIWGARIPLQ
jgi:hypothetical protein